MVASPADIGGGAGGALAGIMNLFGFGGPDGDVYAQRALAELYGLTLPEYDFRALAPPTLRYLGDVRPSLVDPVRPEAPVAVAPAAEGRAGQLRALAALEGFEAGGSPANRLEEAIAADEIARESGRAQEAIASNFAARGRLGGATEALLRAASEQNLGALRADTARGLAADRSNRAIAAALGAGGLAGQIRGADEALAVENARATNRFNELVAQIMNEARFQNVGTRNAFALGNRAERQRISDTNVLGRYETSRENLTRRNALEESLFGARAVRQGSVADQLNLLAGRQDREQAVNRMMLYNTLRSAGQAIGAGVGMGIG